MSEGSQAASSPVATSKDLEGVSDSFKPQAEMPEPAAAGKPNRQRKIAVLTSGGDSAGMNAAGESHCLLPLWSSCQDRS